MACLRWYQRDAVRAVYTSFRRPQVHPCVCLPTGSGKSWVIARIAADTAVRQGGRALVLAHRKELLEQNADKIQKLCAGTRVGLVSAGLGRREVDAPVVVAGVQSVWNRAVDLGRFDVILVDEAHLIPPEGEGMYRSFLDAARRMNPRVWLVGLTATPYRLDSGELCGSGRMLTEVVYEASVRELIVQGYLSPLVSREGNRVADVSSVNLRGGDYAPRELERVMVDLELIDAACREIIDLTRDRRRCLLFASGVEHARLLARAMRKYGELCESVSGESTPSERDRILEDFRSGDLRYLSNCDILTTGFDAPDIDAIALLRPTASPGLYYQMVGRGLRVHPSKRDCLVLDYAGNIRRHGPVDRIRHGDRGEGRGDGNGAPAVKTCPACQALVAAATAACPHCPHVWPRTIARHGSEASWLPPLSESTGWHEVMRTVYTVHRKRGASPDHPRTLRVIYLLAGGERVSDFICVEHVGWPRERAGRWWRARTDFPCPRDASEALRLARRGELREPTRLLVRRATGDVHPRILGHDMPECGEGSESMNTRTSRDDRVPASA